MGNKLEYLLKSHHKDAFLWARQCADYNDDDAKEILQITYLKVIEKKAKYGGKSAFKTWLFSVIRFTAIDYFKKNNVYLGLEQIELMADNQDDIITTDYKSLLSCLPERQQEILILAFYHDMTLTEIADITALHIGTVRTHYQRGKAALKSLILKKAYE